MAKILFKVLINTMLSIASLITAPINAIIAADFPEFSTQLTNFGNLLNTYVGYYVAYFVHILPPALVAYFIWILDSLIILFTISIAAHIIVKVLSLIKRVKVI